jgi:hypothetical protein
LQISPCGVIQIVNFNIRIGSSGSTPIANFQNTIKISVQKWNGSWGAAQILYIPINWYIDSTNFITLEKHGKIYSVFLNDKFLMNYEDNFLNGTGKYGFHTYGAILLDNFQLDSCVNTRFVTQPENTTVSLGDTVMLSSVAVGPNLSYQWQKNNSNISGATNDTLIIYGVQSSDVGNYRCIVSNTYGADTSNNASLSLNIVQAGTYTIDPSGNGDYTNIAAAISDMDINGISGSVIFKIKNGTYSEQISIPQISGASATNTITFESFSGNKNDVVIQYAATAASSNYTVNFNGADYVTFRNLTIKANGTNYGTAVKFGNNADYNTLNNVNIYGKRNANSSDRFSVVYSYQNSSYTTISNSNIYGGSIGINMIGPGWNYKEPGTAIDSNVIDSFSSLGINMQYQRECNVRGNYIHVDNSTGLSNVRGLLFTYSDSIEDVTSNQIIMEADTSYFGIMLNACENASALPSNFSNNMVSVKATAATTLPIGIYSLSTYYHNFYYNTVYLYGNNTSSRAFYHQSGGGIRVENSILYNNAAGFALMFLTGTGTIEHEYNALYTNGSYLLANSTSGTGFYNDLTTWQGVAFDDYYSVIYKPTLVSNTDLHIDTTDFTSVLINGVGRNAGIATDIDGDARGTSHDIGADQFDPGLIPGGTYYLGAADSNTFHSISEFQHIYNSTGATEDLIIKIAPGSYYEQVKFLGGYPSARWTQRVTLESATGNANDVLIYYDYLNSTTNYVIYFSGCCSFEGYILRNLTISAENAVGNYARVIESQTNNLTIENCVLIGKKLTYTTFNADVVVHGLNTQGQPIIFRNNTVRYGSKGLLVHKTTGYGGTTTISGNYFDKNYTGAIEINSGNSAQVYHNEINADSCSNEFFGIELENCNSSKVYRNNIGFLKHGIYLINGNSLSIYDNMVYNKAGAPWSIGINLDTVYNSTFYHNSVLIGEASTSIGAGLSLDAADTNNTFKNNIFANTQGGYAFTNYSTSYTSDYNNFYTSGTYLALQNGLYRNTLLAWQTASGQDQNSLTYSPAFISNTDLHIDTTQLSAAQMDGKGTYVGNTLDIDEELRNTTTPDIGADEYTMQLLITNQPDSVVAAEMDTVQFVIAATGQLPITYQWKKNGVDISGETNDTLSFFGVTTSNVGSYTCLVKNANGSIISDNAYLNVLTLDSGLVAYYPFTGNPGDSSGNNYHGTVSGASLTTDRFGVSNKAYTFNGSNNYIRSSVTTIPQNNEERSVLAWVRSSGVATDRVICDWGSFNYQARAGIILQSNGNLKYVGQSYDISGNSSFDDDQWHLVAATHDGSTTKTYVDGNLDESLARVYLNKWNLFYNGSQHCWS